MVTTITDILNIWNDIGVFSYVIPFLLIFAVVFAILKKTKILGDDNDSILAIISVAVGLLALQFDFVSDFYSVIFPKFGVGLSIFLVLIIFLGFFYQPVDGKWSGAMTWIGWVVGIGVVLWAVTSWGGWNDSFFGWWLSDNFWAIIVGLLIVGTIIGVTKGGSGSTGAPRAR
jgi:hypothetical protein